MDREALKNAAFYQPESECVLYSIIEQTEDGFTIYDPESGDSLFVCWLHVAGDFYRLEKI